MGLVFFNGHILNELNDRWENYSGNNPSKYQADLRLARQTVREIEQYLKDTGLLALTEKEKLEKQLGEAYPNAQSKQVVTFNGKKYIRRFWPVEKRASYVCYGRGGSPRHVLAVSWVLLKPCCCACGVVGARPESVGNLWSAPLRPWVLAQRRDGAVHRLSTRPTGLGPVRRTRPQIHRQSP